MKHQIDISLLHCVKPYLLLVLRIPKGEVIEGAGDVGIKLHIRKLLILYSVLSLLAAYELCIARKAAISVRRSHKIGWHGCFHFFTKLSARSVRIALIDEIVISLDKSDPILRRLFILLFQNLFEIVQYLRLGKTNSAPFLILHTIGLLLGIKAVNVGTAP